MPGEVLHHLLDRRAAATGDAPAVSVGDRTASHAELRDLSLGLAGWLSTRGVGRGDRVALLSPPSVELVGLIYAVSRVGAAFSVLHNEMPVRVRRHVLADLEPRLVITEPPPTNTEPVNALSSPEPGDPACLIYTSGQHGVAQGGGRRAPADGVRGRRHPGRAWLPAGRRRARAAAAVLRLYPGVALRVS
jgi:non-ribosomal peptide synthetase component F